MPCRRVVLCGASSVGKTTLAKQLMTVCPNLQHVDEVARAVLAERGVTQRMLADSLAGDKQLFLSLQLPILRRQYEAQCLLDDRGQPFVSDRGPDALIYVQFFDDRGEEACEDLIDNNPFIAQMLDSYKDKKTLVVLVCPIPGLNVDDGTRMLMTEEEKIIFTHMFRRFFLKHEIPFVDLCSTDRSERLDIVLNAMNA